MQKTIRSSARTKPDPIYYKKIIDRLEPQRNALLDSACKIEEQAETREAVELTAKIRWAIFQLPIAQRMKQQLQGNNS